MVSGKKRWFPSVFHGVFRTLRDGFWQKNGDFLVFFIVFSGP